MWKFLAVVSTLFVLILFTTDIGKKLILDLFTNPNAYTPFPLGEEKEVKIDKRIYMKWRYCISIHYEFIEGLRKAYGENFMNGEFNTNKEAIALQEAFVGSTNINTRMFYIFSVTILKSEGKEYNPFFSKTFTNFDTARSYWANTDNPLDKGYTKYFQCIELKRGSYRFIFIDKNPFIPEFKEVRTFVKISPYTNWK